MFPLRGKILNAPVSAIAVCVLLPGFRGIGDWHVSGSKINQFPGDHQGSGRDICTNNGRLICKRSG